MQNEEFRASNVQVFCGHFCRELKILVQPEPVGKALSQAAQRLVQMLVSTLMSTQTASTMQPLEVDLNAHTPAVAVVVPEIRHSGVGTSLCVGSQSSVQHPERNRLTPPPPSLAYVQRQQSRQLDVVT